MHKKLLTLAALLVPLTMLAGCDSLSGVIGRGTPTTSGSNRPTCISMMPIAPNRGKPGGPSIEDIAAALDRDHPVDRVRNLVGDTSPTLAQIDKSNAALRTLCGGGNAS